MGQLQDWLEDFPLEERRPPLSAAESGCPPALLELMVLIWLRLRPFAFEKAQSEAEIAEGKGRLVFTELLRWIVEMATSLKSD